MRSAQILSRRKFIALSGVAAIAVPLAGCAGLPFTPTLVQSAVTAIQAIGTEITQFLPQISSVAGISTSTVSAIATVVGLIQQAASAVGTATTQSSGAAILTQIETYINDLAPLVLPFLSLIPGGNILGIIIAALPAIEAAVGIVSQLITQAASLAATAPPLPASARFGIGAAGSVSQAYLNLLVQRAQALKAAKARYRK